jgi:DNA topoisomerase-1
MKYLVIVESPSKCKKIEKYLNDNEDFNIFEVVATMGHITELKTLKNIDIQNNFAPTYETVDAKINAIDTIRYKIGKVDEVILACDNDREGESICYHICTTFGLPLTTKRIIFNEITEKAVKHAIQNPTTINMNLVYAQQSRQILDLVVGFKVTPSLWNYISKKLDTGLSAGRCQTPALRLIYDNYLENKALSQGTKTFNISGIFTNLNLSFQLTKNIENEIKVNAFLSESVDYNHQISCSTPKNTTKQPPSPFTTSTLQQCASNELHYSPKETMKYCQELYENGYITYMRTECDKYCVDFLKEMKQYISNNYTENYVNDKYIETCIENAKIINYPHEAIRPTSISTKTITSNDKKLVRMYNLIWKNAVESCMKESQYSTFTSEITAPNNYKYKYTCEKMVFPGWKIVENKTNTDEDAAYSYLQSMKKNTEIKYKKIIAEQTLKKLPNHYTEAFLVQLLEKNGIGRPSTFAMLVDKLQERSYVKKENIPGQTIDCTDYILENEVLTRKLIQKNFGAEKNKLVIQPVGIIVIEFLLKHYATLFDYGYTKEMEDQLDKVANGEMEWVRICENCNQEIEQLEKSLSDETRCNIKIDDSHFYIIGKHGPVIKHIDATGKTSFKQVKTDIDISILEKGGYKLEDVLAKITQNNIGKYKGEDLIVKRGQYGLYVAWGDKKKSLTCFGNRPVENITLEEVTELLDKENDSETTKTEGYLREISENISIRRSKHGDYIYYKTPAMKTPKFFKLAGFKEDHRNCDKSLLRLWIHETYKIK